MNVWKKVFSLSLVVFQLSAFGIRNIAYADEETDESPPITLAGLHRAKYDLSNNTDLSFGKLYSDSVARTSLKSRNLSRHLFLSSELSRDEMLHYSGSGDEDYMACAQANAVKGIPASLPTSISDDGMDFNPESSPWQNEGVTVDFELTGDDTAVIEKSGLRCYDYIVLGGNHSIKPMTVVDSWKDAANSDEHTMDEAVEDEDMFYYYKHGDGWGYGERREEMGIQDGKYGTDLGVSDEIEDFFEDSSIYDEDDEDYDDIDDLDDDDLEDLYEEYMEEEENPQIYMWCRSSGTKYTRVHQIYGVSKVEFTVVHAEDVNGRNMTNKVSVDTSGLEYNLDEIEPDEVYETYKDDLATTKHEGRVTGTIVVDGKGSNKEVAANIVIKATVTEWKYLGWGYIEDEEVGPIGDIDFDGSSAKAQFARVTDKFDLDGGDWFNNTGTEFEGPYHDGYWNNYRSYNEISNNPAETPVDVKLTYEQKSSDDNDEGYNIDETDPEDLLSKSWIDETGDKYTRGTWVNKDVTTQIYSRDNLSGIDTDRSYVNIKDRSWYRRNDSTKHYFDYDTENIINHYKEYDLEDTITFSEDGIYSVYGKLWDIAENTHTDTHGEYKVDFTDPDLPIYSDDNRVYIDDDLKVTVTLRDNLSGVDHVRYCVTRSPIYNDESTNLVNITTPENSPHAATSYNTTIKSNGTWYIHTWVWDRAGNMSYKVSNGYKYFKITEDDITVNPTENNKNILRGTRFDVVTTIPYFTQEDGHNSKLHYIMPNWVYDDVEKKVNGEYAVTPGSSADTIAGQYGPKDQAILWKAYVVPYGTPLTKDWNGNTIGSTQKVTIRLQYIDYIYGEKITHDLDIYYSIIPEQKYKTEIIQNNL